MPARTLPLILWFPLLVPALLPAQQPAVRPKISEAKNDGSGILSHTVECGYQDRPTTLRVLLPGKLEPGRRYPVVYVLPVEAGLENRYGDGLAEIAKLGLHEKYGVICVMPSFARLPWYADHPTNASIRQESYFLRVVLPFIEEKYPVLARSEGRLLLGFSKSGWGAWALLLRHPDRFGKAVAWDAPLRMDAPGKYGSGEIFGDAANFSQYQVSRLLEQQAGKLGDGKRLALLGHGNFRGEHQATHEAMTRLKIPHEYRDSPSRKHDWHSGWVAEGMAFLAGK
jgi:S-formylglutathione hydrolase FrmB